jgi:hypothetical protein
VKWQAITDPTSAAAPTYTLSTSPNNGENTQPIGVRNRQWNLQQSIKQWRKDSANNVNTAHKCPSGKQQHVIVLEIN